MHGMHKWSSKGAICGQGELSMAAIVYQGEPFMAATLGLGPILGDHQ